jgi:hypothetical protein
MREMVGLVSFQGMRRETGLGCQSDAPIAVWEYRQFVPGGVLWHREGVKAHALAN